MKHIPLPLYKKIYAAVPLPCVDLVVHDARGRALLVRRKNQPERGKWWFPGGRLLRGERLFEAAMRKLKEETGLRGRVVRMLGVHEYFAHPGAFSGTMAHNIAFVFLMRVKGNMPPAVADRQSAECRWFSGIPRGLDPYPAKYLRFARRRPARRALIIS